MCPLLLPPVLRKLCPRRFYHLACAALVIFGAAFAEAAVEYNLDFEEPAHHLGSQPSTGGPPDKVTTVIGTFPVYGRDTVIPPPTIVTAPAGLNGQALKLPFGYPHTNPASRGITLGATAGLSANFTISFDVIPQFAGAGYF